MATKTWIGNAHDVKQISTITVAGSWSAADTGTMTINGKDIVVTVGTTGTATTAVAIALKEAWMSATRLDGTGTTDSTSNAGGQEFGEFSEATASVSGSVVTLIANRAGVPFTLTVGDTSAGSLTAATPQAATGKHFWNNADNWDTGTVPVDDDVVVFRDSDVSVKYGLPNSTDLEVTIQHWMSYTGEIGLPEVNRDGIPYHEYRQRYVRLDDGGTGSDIAHRFGLGDSGLGSSLINLKHITAKCSPVVYNTGLPLNSRLGTKALNLCCTANTSTLNIINGSVDWSSQDSGTSAFAAVSQVGGDSRGVTGVKTSGAITLSGGSMLVGGSSANLSIVVRGGSMRVEGQTGAVDILTLYDGAICEYLSTAAVDLLTGNGGTFDARGNAGSLTVAATLLNTPTRILDPYRRITFTTPMLLSYDPSPDLLLGTDPDNPAEVGT